MNIAIAATAIATHAAAAPAAVVVAEYKMHTYTGVRYACHTSNNIHIAHRINGPYH